MSARKAHLPPLGPRLIHSREKRRMTKGQIFHCLTYLVGLIVLLLMLMCALRLHAEDYSREIWQQGQVIDYLTKPAGRLDRMEEHIDNTDRNEIENEKNVAEIQSEIAMIAWFMKVGIPGLVALQSLGLIRSFRRSTP
jgi:hypothetical protein